MPRLAANFGLLLAAAIWGGGFIAQHAAGHLGAAWFTGLRFCLAFLAVLPFGLFEARRAAHPVAPAHLWLLLPLGLSFFAGVILQQWAMTHTSVTHVGFLTGLYVIFVPVLETLFRRRLPHITIWVAALLALAGTACLSGGLGRLSLGDGLTILAALAFAVQILLLDRFVKVSGRPVLAALVQSAACVLLGLTLGAFGGPLRWATLGLILWPLVYAGALSGGIAFLLQAVFQRFTPAADAAVMLMAESLFAALFAALLLGERMGAGGWLGCGLLFTSLLLAQAGALLAPVSKQAAAGAEFRPMTESPNRGKTDR